MEHTGGKGGERESEREVQTKGVLLPGKSISSEENSMTHFLFSGGIRGNLAEALLLLKTNRSSTIKDRVKASLSLFLIQQNKSLYTSIQSLCTTWGKGWR